MAMLDAKRVVSASRDQTLSQQLFDLLKVFIGQVRTVQLQ